MPFSLWWPLAAAYFWRSSTRSSEDSSARGCVGAVEASVILGTCRDCRCVPESGRTYMVSREMDSGGPLLVSAGVPASVSEAGAPVEGAVLIWVSGLIARSVVNVAVSSGFSSIATLLRAWASCRSAALGFFGLRKLLGIGSGTLDREGDVVSGGDVGRDDADTRDECELARCRPRTDSE